MVAYHRSSALHAYVLAVSAVGLCPGRAPCARRAGRRPCCSQPPAVLGAAGQPGGHRVAARSCSKVSGGTQLVTTAEAFAFAILLGWGTTAAVLALALAVLVSDAAPPGRAREDRLQRRPVRPAHGRRRRRLRAPRRRPSLRPPRTSRRSPWPPLVFFVGNLVLVGVVTTLAHGRNFVADLKECLRAEAWPYAMVFGMAPIMLVVAEQSVGLLPLVLLPLFAVRDALRTAEEADEHRDRRRAGGRAGRAGRGRARPGSPRPSTPWSSGCGRATGSRTTCWRPSPTSCAPPWPGCWARWPP